MLGGRLPERLATGAATGGDGVSTVPNAPASHAEAAVLQIGRDLGLVEWLQEVLPEVVVDAFVLLTQLGDTWLLFVALTAFYWFGRDRRRGALAVALGVGGLALVVALKHWFALSRPPEAVWAADTGGYGFPSGHALGATVVWGALALLADRWSNRRQVLVASAVVAVVALSRVVLGVHYTGDVLAGVLVGSAYLAVALAVSGRDTTRAFGLAAVVGLAAVAVGGGPDALATLGAALGGGLAWASLDLQGRSVAAPVAIAGFVVLGGLWAAVVALDPPWLATLAANVLVGGGIVALPRASDAVRARMATAARS